MRRCALLASVLASALALGGCSGSGFWRYEQDTLTLPGANPNKPVGSSENFSRSRYGSAQKYAPEPVAPAPLLTEAGDIWPGPTKNVPTLKDLQKQQTAEMGGNGTAALQPLPPLPSLPGYEISPQQNYQPPPNQVFHGSVSLGQNAPAVPVHGNQGYRAPANDGGGDIVVPNGNGTSTVISPDGTVRTVPTPK